MPVGEALAARDGRRWLAEPEAEWLPAFRAFATDAMMDLVRADLDALGVRHDLFRSERALVGEGRVDDAYAALEADGLIYRGVLEPPKGRREEDWEPREQSLFRATRFGDDSDRPLRKSDGTWTYFATDIAYHRDKIERGFVDLIDVWGADHGGYVKRMKAAVSALSGEAAALDVKICQMVKILDGGTPVAMSKRAGRFVTLRDVVDEVGKDVVRFIMLTRRNDAPLEFDLQRVTEQSRDNPVFYVQYAHARACSALRRGADVVPHAELAPAALARADLASLDDAAEIDLIRRLCQWPRVLAGAALAHEPHRIAFHLQELAGAFHLLWTRGKDDARLRFVDAERPAETRAAPRIDQRRQAGYCGGAGTVRSGTGAGDVMSAGDDGSETPSAPESPDAQAPQELVEGAGEDGAAERGRLRLLPVWILLGAAVISGGAWAVTERLGEGPPPDGAEVRLVAAPTGAWKVRPDDPGGMEDPEPGQADLRDPDDGRSGGGAGAHPAAAGRAAEAAAADSGGGGGGRAADGRSLRAG